MFDQCNSSDVFLCEDTHSKCVELSLTAQSYLPYFGSLSTSMRGGPLCWAVAVSRGRWACWHWGEAWAEALEVVDPSPGLLSTGQSVSSAAEVKKHTHGQIEAWWKRAGSQARLSQLGTPSNFMMVQVYVHVQLLVLSFVWSIFWKQHRIFWSNNKKIIDHKNAMDDGDIDSFTCYIVISYRGEVGLHVTLGGFAGSPHPQRLIREWVQLPWLQHWSTVHFLFSLSNTVQSVSIICSKAAH